MLNIKKIQNHLIIILLLIVNISYSDTITLENEYLYIEINSDTTSNLMGTITNFLDKKKQVSPTNISWFNPIVGKTTAIKKELITKNKNSVLFKFSNFTKAPTLTATILYTLKNSTLTATFKSWVTQKTEFSEGFFLDITGDYDKAICSNSNQKSAILDASTEKKQNDHLDTKILFSNNNVSTLFLIRNPFHSLWTFNANGAQKHQLNVLPLVHSQGLKRDVQEGPFICSTINPEDTIVRRIEISPAGKIEIPLYFSEHPNGYSQTMTMYWDELPNRDHWAFMTTEDDKRVKYDHFWIKLLNAHPKIVMGYLLLCDRLLYREHSTINNWDVLSDFVILDTLEEHSGTFCVSMIAQRDTTIKIHQKVKIKPSTKYNFTYWQKTESVSGSGAYAEIYFNNNTNITAGKHITGSSDWEKHTVSFISGKNDSVANIYARIESSKGIVLFDDMALTENSLDKNLILNESFEQNKPYFMYDTTRRHWSDIHGYLHLTTEAPKPYLHFLQRIENDSLKYGWENRVRLGVHGYHHTPSLFEPDKLPPGWEFQRYDPYGDSLRLHRIFEDMKTIGLHKKSMRFWRSPGVRYTKSLVDILVDSGFVFMDPYRDDYKGQFFCPFVQRGKNRLWMPRLTWWGDIQGRDYTGSLMDVLSRGHLAHIGGHPEQVFKNAKIESYNFMDNLFSEIESKYPNIGYIFPDDYSDNANDIYELNTTTINKSNSTINWEFSGTVKKGNSLILEGFSDEIIFDGVTLTKNNYKIIDSITYIVLPDSKLKKHTLSLKNVYLSSHIKTPQKVLPFLGNKFHWNGKNLEIFLSKNHSVSLELYNTAGRKVFETKKIFLRANKNYKIKIPNEILVAGFLIFKINIDNKIKSYPIIKF